MTVKLETPTVWAKPDKPNRTAYTVRDERDLEWDGYTMVSAGSPPLRTVKTYLLHTGQARPAGLPAGSLVLRVPPQP